MILLDDKLISEDIIDQHFVCDIKACKGNCCVKGDAGAPLLVSEIDHIDRHLALISQHVDPEGKALIQEEGFHKSEGANHETNCRPTGECVFVQYKNGIATCGIENANAQHHFGFQKPLSCHLYPIRLSKVGDYTALNYHKWSICKPACKKGAQTATPIYQFLKESLTRAFGTDFYQKLHDYAESQS